uniref:Uncharacterized protein n=1 Tax=Physcomitrium patens TaxID=3218 RepID=A0A2K1JR75_PHYPA|nr:hypothetical protein PHYPA_016329 [Physcomitrium patens]
MDIMEAGTLITSPDDLQAVRRIAAACSNHEAVKHAFEPHIYTFIAASEIHMVQKLKNYPDEVLQIARDVVYHARNLC